MLVLSPPEFSIFTALIEERVGLSYTLADKPIFESKLSARVLEAGYESALDYYYCLRYDDPEGREFEALAQALLVHETFFFRELPPLRVAIERLLKPLIEQGRKVRVWCAACSTGEEPLSFAMLLASMGLLPHVELVASDLSARAVERAQKGKFGPRALRQPLPDWAEPFLSRTDAGFEVARALVKAIEWRTLNLLDRAVLERLAPFDLVLCRNVLIYFREETTRSVVESLAGRIRPGGALLVGVSESLMRFRTSLSCEELAGAFVYRKTDAP